MDKFSFYIDKLQHMYESQKISKYEYAILLESTVEKLKGKVTAQQKIKSINKMIYDLQIKASQVNSKNKKLVETWNYNEAIANIKELIKDAKTIESKINSERSNIEIPKDKLDSAMEKVKKIEDTATECINDLKKREVKKNLRRFDNRYWIDYTKKHNQAFQDVEKELTGSVSKDGKNHDMDKYIMYHFLPAPIAHALHVQFSHHHKKHARTERDFRNMMIDMECNRRTKPDKQMKPYEVIDKFYPELKPQMDPVLEKYGLPRNAKEDREMELKKKLGLKK